MLRPSVIAVLDGVKGDVTVVSPAWISSGLTARAAYAQAAERVMDAVRDLERAPASETRGLGQVAEVAEPVSNFTHSGYLAAVERAKEYIRAGDIFQVVPSQRWAQPFTLPPFALYRSLRRTNPSPFMFYFNFGGFQVIGASPGNPRSRSSETKSRSVPSPEHGRVAQHPSRTGPMRQNCSPIQRNGQST